MKRMLVTGGSGYLGGWVARRAHPTWEVTATYFRHRPRNAASGIRWVQLDVRDAQAVHALVHRLHPAVIVHTAALNPGQGNKSGEDEFEAVNADGTRHVAQAATAGDIRLIHISTDVVFDGKNGAYTEEDEPSPVTPYGKSKAHAEDAVWASGASAVIVRTSLLYGWRHTLDRQSRWVVESLQAGAPIRLFTDEFRCPIWVESLAAALVELAGVEYSGVLHIAGAQALSRYAFGCRLARFYGLPDAGITPVLSRTSGLLRPLDCTLDCHRARTLLRTPLPGVDEVLTLSRSSRRSGPLKPLLRTKNVATTQATSVSD